MTPNLPLVLSLALCAAVAASWAMSWLSPFGARDEHARAGSPAMLHAWTFYSQWGRVQWSWGSSENLPAPLAGYFRDSRWQPDAAHPLRRLGIYAEHVIEPRNRRRFWYFSIPYPILFAPTLPWPAWLWARRRRSRRRQDREKDGLCLGCGYDLRASTGRCPECGRIVNPGASPSESSDAHALLKQALPKNS